MIIKLEQSIYIKNKSLNIIREGLKDIVIDLDDLIDYQIIIDDINEQANAENHNGGAQGGALAGAIAHYQNEIANTVVGQDIAPHIEHNEDNRINSNVQEIANDVLSGRLPFEVNVS